MAKSVESTWHRVGMTLAVLGSLAACSGGASLAPSPVASPVLSPVVSPVVSPVSSPVGTTSPSSSPSSSSAMGGLPYRVDLPAGWIALGSSAYDTRIDSTPDVRKWLAGLGLEGRYAFRAYEPVAGAAGMRLAVNPQRTWNPSPLQEQGAVEALPGVTGKVSSDVVVTGRDWKAFGYRWSETMDWGTGAPTARDCIGYFVMLDPNPVNLVVCYPAGTDRSADADAIASTFVMTGTAAFTPPPGTSPTASPTPFDKSATPAPSAALHVVPELEALLPATLDGRRVAKESQTGVERGMTDTSPILAAFGKHPADVAMAQGTVLPGEDRPAAIIGVTRLRGVAGSLVLAETLKSMPDAKVSQVRLGGHAVTLVEYGAWPVWMYATGEDVYSIGLAGEAIATEFFAALP